MKWEGTSKGATKTDIISVSVVQFKMFKLQNNTTGNVLKDADGDRGSLPASLFHWEHPGVLWQWGSLCRG